MLELTDVEKLNKQELAVFNILKRIVEQAVWICRCKADGTVINNHSPLKEKQFLKLKIEEALVSTFPEADSKAFDITVFHPSDGEKAVNEVMEIDDSQIEYSIELYYDLPYYIELISKRTFVTGK